MQKARAQVEDEASFEEGLLKFSNSLVASTSQECDQIQIWETQTMAPLENFKSEKFFISPNTLQVSHTGFLVGCHIQKTTLAAWRWEKTSQPCLKSPTKEELSVVRMFGSLQGQDMLVCGTKKGKLQVYSLNTGALLMETDSAHYLAITDLDVAKGTPWQGDLIITGGKDTKVKVWTLAALLSVQFDAQDQGFDLKQEEQRGLYAEFGEHTSEVTQVKFSYGAGIIRAFSCSLDKTFRVYDIPSKTILKQIQVQSPILKMEVDQTEQYAYLACDNLNVYQHPLQNQVSNTHQESMSQLANAIQANQQIPVQTNPKKKALTHKKRITAMCMSVDGSKLITGDASGLIYVWSLKDQQTDSKPMRVQTSELHKDKGPITNLIPLKRPLSLFGLTANMQGYEPGDLKALYKAPNGLNDPSISCSVQLYERQGMPCKIEADLAEYEELQYFQEAAMAVTAPPVTHKVESDGEEFMTVDTKPDQSEIQKLKDENSRLKRALVDKLADE